MQAEVMQVKHILIKGIFLIVFISLFGMSIFAVKKAIDLKEIGGIVVTIFMVVFFAYSIFKVCVGKVNQDI